MTNSHPAKLTYHDFPAARSLFRSIFMEGWNDKYATWQEAMRGEFHQWSFTRESCAEIVAELDHLLTYPNVTLTEWLPKICSGLPNGTPDPRLTTHEFITQARDLVMPAMEEKEAGRRK